MKVDFSENLTKACTFANTWYISTSEYRLTLYYILFDKEIVGNLDDEYNTDSHYNINSLYVRIKYHRRYEYTRLLF